MSAKTLTVQQISQSSDAILTSPRWSRSCTSRSPGSSPRPGRSRQPGRCRRCPLACSSHQLEMLSGPTESRSNLPHIRRILLWSTTHHAILPKSGGFLLCRHATSASIIRQSPSAQGHQAQATKQSSSQALTSLKCTHPPAPPPPAPPWSLAPPAPPEPASLRPPAPGPRPRPPSDPPPGDANACAAARRSGSRCACAARTSPRTARKRGLPSKERGVGGSAVVVPTARLGFGGVASR